MSEAAYQAGVDLLRRRELSEAQVRERLAEAGHKPKAIETAVAKLKQAGAIDDLRAAEAIVRTETAAKKRSKLRVRLQVERAGIAAAIARRVVDDHFATMDDDVIMEAILEKRLRGRDTISSESELQRLQRYLVGQGFEPDRVARALAARQRTRPSR